MHISDKVFKDLLLSGELSSRIQKSVIGENLAEPGVLQSVLKPLFSQHSGVEKFYIIYLTSRLNVIKTECLFSGTLTTCGVYPREVVKQCLACDAASIVIAHNHPSGHSEPSTGDIKLTAMLYGACRTMGIYLIEHIIFGGNHWYSMQEAGVLDQLEERWTSYCDI